MPCHTSPRLAAAARCATEQMPHAAVALAVARSWQCTAALRRPVGPKTNKQTNKQPARSKPNRASLRIGAHATNGPAPTDCSLIGRSALAYARKLRLESVQLVGAGLRRLGRGLEVHQPLPEPNGSFTLGAISDSRVRVQSVSAARGGYEYATALSRPPCAAAVYALCYAAFGIAIACRAVYAVCTLQCRTAKLRGVCRSAIE